MKFISLLGDNILLDHRCGFLRNRSTTGHILILCVRQILEKNGKIYIMLQKQLLVDFKKGCVLVCFIFALMRLVTFLKIRLNETFNKARIGKYLSLFLTRMM